MNSPVLNPLIYDVICSRCRYEESFVVPSFAELLRQMRAKGWVQKRPGRWGESADHIPQMCPRCVREKAA